MKDYWYYIIGSGLILLVSAGKAIDRFYKDRTIGKIGVISSLVFSLIGGVLAGLLSTVYIEVVQLQWVFIAGGAWMGERILQAIGALVESKIDLIFKSNQNDKQDENKNE